MTADSFGPKKQPRFSDSGAPDTAVDPTLVSDYAAEVGNRKVLSTAERTALTGSAIWEGLQIWDKDLKQPVDVVAGVQRLPSGTSNGWTYDVLPSGKRIFRRRYDDWFGVAFGPAGSSGWIQDRATGITPPTGTQWTDFGISVDVYPSDLTNNGGQIVIQGRLTKVTGSSSALLRYFNPSALTIDVPYTSLVGVITLIEK